jgi:hypothetical protein
MAKSTPRTDFEDEVLDEQTPAEATPPEKDKDGVPYCVKHHCRMQQTSGGKAGSPVAYFKCPVDGCDEKAKRVKSVRSVPTDAMKCSRCAGLSPRPIMERDAAVSTLMYTILKCPCCGHKSSPQPRPEFVANHARGRGVPQVEEIGAR